MSLIDNNKIYRLTNISNAKTGRLYHIHFGHERLVFGHGCSFSGFNLC